MSFIECSLLWRSSRLYNDRLEPRGNAGIQRAYRPRFEGSSRRGRAGVFEFFELVYRDDDEALYAREMGAAYLAGARAQIAPARCGDRVVAVGASIGAHSSDPGVAGFIAREKVTALSSLVGGQKPSALELTVGPWTFFLPDSFPSN